MRVGVSVICVVCGRTKCPRGRSQPLSAHYYCDTDCSGWIEEPKVGDLWPGETEEDFGYPVSANGTREHGV